MFIDANSLVINNVNMAQYITQVEYQYNKLWASDSGRNLAGSQTGTLIGIFPKLVVQFKPLTKTQLETIAPILDSASQTVTYYDPNKKANVTMSTYTGDWKTINKNVVGGIVKNDGFSISFIARNKRA